MSQASNSSNNNNNNNNTNKNDNDTKSDKDTTNSQKSYPAAVDPEWQFPNRPPPQQIPNTPFFLYPAKNQNTNQNNEKNAKSNQNNDTNEKNSMNESKSEEKTENNNSTNESNSKSKSKRIVSVEIDKNTRNMMPRLTNDLNNVMFEIDTIHNRIFHLRRTNKEIKQFYSDDVDCQQAYKENIDVINKNLENLFVYFDLYTDLTNGQIHKYASLYETDKKVIKKYQNIDSKSVEYMMPAVKSNQETEKNNDNSNTGSSANQTKMDVQSATPPKDEADDNGIAIDDDGGITL